MTANDKLRVLHVGKFYPPHKGGMESHLQSLCGELKKSIDVEVVVASDDRYSSEEMVEGVKVTRIGNVLEMAAAPICPGMVRKIRQIKADIIHLHLPNPTAILAYLASGHTGKLVVTYHSDVVRQRILGRVFQPILHETLKRCAALIATSPNYVDSSPLLSAYRDRCHVIPLGIEVRQFQQRDAAAVAGIREQYGERIVISVGRLTYYKGFEYLIRAMAEVKGRLLIVGTGPLRKDLERETQRCGLNGRVIFLGEVENLVSYYHAADLFVLASVARSEAFGIVQLEAMACGKAVVNTRLESGVPFVSVDKITGLTVPPTNSRELARAINQLLDDPACCTRYGQAGRRRVEQEFSLEVMARRTLQLYQDVMRSPSKPRRITHPRTTTA